MRQLIRGLLIVGSCFMAAANAEAQNLMGFTASACFLVGNAMALFYNLKK